MPEKTPGGPLPGQTGTQQKGAAIPGKSTEPIGKSGGKGGGDQKRK